MAKGTRLKRKDVIAALRRSRGLIAYAARSLGVAREALHTFITRNNMRAELASIREANLDRVEALMWQAMEAGDGSMIRFYLEKVGRSRGYAGNGELVLIRDGREPDAARERLAQLIERHSAVIEADRAAEEARTIEGTTRQVTAEPVEAQPLADDVVHVKREPGGKVLRIEPPAPRKAFLASSLQEIEQYRRGNYVDISPNL